ncbi:AMP-binding protein [Streptomyces sp. NBC_00467]|uniref:AMP-binding protein n=1 Tax=Streptomyces sp. NBC_00467 TaxID=2975752 RepID=UPI002E1742FE
MTTAAVPDGVTTLPGLFARTVAEHADQPAITDADGVLTYRELDELSDAVSGLLRLHGVSPGDRVALCVAHSSGSWAAVLGILKRGAVYVTVETCDPAGPSEPVLRMGGATLCLSDMPRPKAHRCPRVLVIPLADAGPHTAVYHSAPHPRLATAACVVAPTSEADGPCRALIVDHTYIVARADGWAGEESTPALQGERFGYFGDVPLSAVQLSLWVGLAHGAHLVVLPSLTCLLERGLREELSRRGITALALPVAALDHGVRKEAGGFAALRVLVVEGDGLAPEVCRMLVGAGFDGRLVHVTGPADSPSWRVVSTRA